MTGSIEACPRCEKLDRLELMETVGGTLSIKCAYCGFERRLDCTIPCGIAEIVREWNRKVGT